MTTNLAQISVSYEQVQQFASNAVADLTRDHPRNFKSGKSMQMGQILAYLFPNQVADIIEANGFSHEAVLIREFFDVRDVADCSGLINAVPGAWSVDRIMKNIFKTKSTNFCWADTVH